MGHHGGLHGRHQLFPKLGSQPILLVQRKARRPAAFEEERIKNPGRYAEVHEEAAHILDSWTRSEIVALDYALVFVFMLVFFSLDAMFLRVCNARAQLPFLKLIYLVVGTTLGVMVILKQFLPNVWDLDGGLLPFLMSPLPSFLLVLFPWMLRKNM